MTLPRRYLPHQTYAATRRTSGRQFFLLPSEELNRIVRYALAVAAERHPLVHVHAFVAMSNHLHLLLTDVSGPDERSELSDFFATLHSLIARAVNAHLGRGGHFWGPGSWRSQEIHDLETLEDKLLYLWTNPVKDGLTPTLALWPGVFYGPGALGRTYTVPKPAEARFGGPPPSTLDPDYRADLAQARALRRRAGLTPAEWEEAERKLALSREREARRAPRSRPKLPSQATLCIHPPPGYEHLSLDELRAYLSERLAQRTRQLQDERRTAGKGFLGPAGVLASSPLDSSGPTPATYEREPRVACKERELRVVILLTLLAWRAYYRDVRSEWPKKRREFPLGTHELVVHHGAELMSHRRALELGLIPGTGPPLHG